MKLERASSIRQLLFAKGQMTIAEIAEAVNASEPTVRRDLIELEAKGLIERSHGSARIAEETGAEIGFEMRERIRLEEKRAISEAAYQRLRPRTSVFLDAGTTVLQLARLIRLSPMPLKIFTNCLPVAQVLMATDDVELTLIGGAMRAENASMVGPLAEAMVGRLHFDQVFLGMGALGSDGCIYTAHPQEAQLNALTLERSEQAVILADASKFGSYLTHFVAEMSSGMALISDTGLDAEWQERLVSIGVATELAELPA
ncbi:DeoR/GlpR family DNA-binding transcription regulator [Pseudoroseicyclus sp. H15]